MVKQKLEYWSYNIFNWLKAIRSNYGQDNNQWMYGQMVNYVQIMTNLKIKSMFFILQLQNIQHKSKNHNDMLMTI
jgi:hypothetical protein